ncbi:phosphatases II [Hypoxylon trugodes]|uniref:phosphatases II n=1 Tax=Hypoxylon trugodes TaxID=326681 RepID=UPI0021948DB3|nr:phosphatases II [Hypoxylon trugodes]KAI1386727.1 phosphatases II [Hypoxylon trugodes]
MAVEMHQSSQLDNINPPSIQERLTADTAPRRNAIPAAPYSMRAPSPPPIVIPAPNLHHMSEYIKVVPDYEKVDPASLSPDNLKIITQNHREQLATDSAANWAYESRHVAQPVLDYLYLGPFGVVRDRQWLRDNGITMLLAARDSKMADIRLMVADKVAQELNIQAAYVDVSNYTELVRAFPKVVQTINDHMLRIYREQRLNSVGVETGEGEMAIPSKTFRRGKVLVFCETGNDRSAGVVVAYLMSVFGMGLIEACQFVHFKRFCVSMTDELRFVLKSYEDIISAQRTVHRYELNSNSSLVDSDRVKISRSKRVIEDTMDEDEDMEGGGEPLAIDQDRFLGRQTFVPFIDFNTNLQE